MDENRLTTLLVAATDEVARGGFDPAEDLRRGRSARRRRRLLATTAAALGAAAVVAVVFALSGQVLGRTAGTKAPSGGGGPAPVATATTTTVEESTTSPGSSPTSLSYTNKPNTGGPADQAAFGRFLFDIAQEHLDPAHNRMEWSEGFTGSDGGARKEWGRKFGWQAPGEKGQAMVYVGVGNIPAPDRVPCGTYDYQGTRQCSPTTLPNGAPAQLLDSTTRREVHWSRPDGSYVFVIVDATFGNNSTVATTSALPTLAQLEAFVMDSRLVLPPG
jgi:hypothetical protein